jgi:hypothetical protein
VGSTKASKNDSNDALATAIAGLRHCGLRAVRVGDHTAVLGMLIDRYDDLVALRTQAACRLHVALRELIAGGAPPPFGGLTGQPSCCATSIPRVLLGSHASVSQWSCWPTCVASTATSPPPSAAVSDAVTASGTSLLELHGVGPIVAKVHPGPRR